MSKIALIIIGLILLYSITIIAPVACDGSLFSKWGFCYWFYNHPVIFYVALIVLIIILNSLIKLIKRKEIK